MKTKNQPIQGKQEGEKCYCLCHALEFFGWDQKTRSCKHCTPQKQEEWISLENVRSRNNWGQLEFNVQDLEKISSLLKEHDRKIRERVEKLKTPIYPMEGDKAEEITWAAQQGYADCRDEVIAILEGEEE